ncbi:neuronal acetylcholine receptor subunit alpha-10-like isoform X2 [Paramacrobiotus metropolitanus]|uniref:neuronal acetylcholine receptor subunit alpha-10-like isoform X2 n=1 Tax=Paramacrobiotus metropolitanus TaxID=2943436 RepID=UPI002445DB59|nr:neuronal acetylcholine receptor subunit alpha-10-like isoform X2 [Paramacrobiotus metropolitanus]
MSRFQDVDFGTKITKQNSRSIFKQTFFSLYHFVAGYNKDIRPTINHTESVRVVFGLSLTQIISVDERNQIMTTNCWLSQNWMDNKLIWNPIDFGNVTSLMLPMDQIWKPDILLYNNADSEYYHKMINTNGIIQYDGNVTWLASSIIRSTCAIDVRYFPFDYQSCSLKFASWTFDGYKVDLVVITEAGDVSNYVPSGEWDLVNISAKRTVVYYSCCAEPYPDITVHILLRRRPLYYVFNYLMPCGCATLFAFLGFYTPGECGEKVTLGITTLLSLTLFLLMVMEVMPPTATSLPLIATFYGICMFFIGLTTAVQVWTLNLHYRGARGQRVPKWIKKVIMEFVATTLCIHTGTQGTLRPASPTNYLFPEKYSAAAKETIMRESSNVKKLDSEHSASSMDGQRQVNSPASRNTASDLQVMKDDLRARYTVHSFAIRIQRMLNHVCELIEANEQHVQKEIHLDEVTQEWKNLAYVVDKLLFILFFIIITIFSSTLFLLVPTNQSQIL